MEVISGSAVYQTAQETSGSAPCFQFSPHGPHNASRQPETYLLKDDVQDVASPSTVSGIGRVWVFPQITNTDPHAILMRTELPRGCDGDWYINFETYFGHASGQSKNNTNIMFSIAGRLSSAPQVSNANNDNTAGNWTSSVGVNFTSNGGLKNPGFFPFSPTPDGQGQFPIAVPGPPGDFVMTKSRTIKLSDFLNNGTPAADIVQGAVLDCVLARDKDPSTNGLGNTDIRVHTIKVRYMAISGS